MKIIAVGSGDNLLAEISRDEIANILGYNSQWAMKQGELKIGDQINIAKIFKKLKGLEEAEAILKSHADKLREFANYLELDLTKVIVKIDKIKTKSPEEKSNRLISVGEVE